MCCTLTSHATAFTHYDHASTSNRLSTDVQKTSYSYRADPQYEHMVRQLIEHIPQTFNFGQFRTVYARTSFYDPIGEISRDALLEQAFIVQTSDDITKIKAALKSYHKLLNTHLANMNVLLQAIALSRDDKRLGNTQWLIKIKKGLLDNILSTGDGKTLKTAYDVITLGEEDMLLAYLGFDVQETEYKNQHMLRYNIHIGHFIDYPDPKRPEGIPLFVNISIPIRHIEHLKNQIDQAPDLGFKGSP